MTSTHCVACNNKKKWFIKEREAKGWNSVAKKVFISLQINLSSYIGKPERTLWERTEEHVYKCNKEKEQSTDYEQLSTCENCNHFIHLFNADNVPSTWARSKYAQIRNNTFAIDKANNRNALLPRKHTWLKHLDHP